MSHNAKKKRNRRTLHTGAATLRLFGGRKHRPCHYCKRKLSINTATFDHKVALSVGGYDKTKNGVIACRDCNSRKGSMSADAFMELRQESQTNRN